MAELLGPGPLRASRAGWIVTIARWASGVIFVAFGLGKFINHASETASFNSYGLPSPGTFAYAIGVLEVVGGLLLLTGLGTRLIAVLLAGDMVGAIVVSGILRGESVSLTLAPALLVAMLALLVLGGGRLSLDARPAGARPGAPSAAAPPHTTRVEE